MSLFTKSLLKIPLSEREVISIAKAYKFFDVYDKNLPLFKKRLDIASGKKYDTKGPPLEDEQMTPLKEYFEEHPIHKSPSVDTVKMKGKGKRRKSTKKIKKKISKKTKRRVTKSKKITRSYRSRRK
jgi:hypothetical protein